MYRPTLRFLLCALLAFVLTVTAIGAGAQTYTRLSSFYGRNGKLPYAGVAIGPGGVLYGTTSQGGAADYGTVYRLAHRGSGWVLTTLYEFKGGTDGAFPYGGITFGPDGYMYGTTYGGGDNNHGTVFRISAPAGPCFSIQCPWNETVLYRFHGGSDGAYPLFENVVFDKAGILYGTTTGDAGGNAGTVFTLTHSNGGWSETILYSFAHGEQPYAGVSFDGAGNLYSTTAGGGLTTGPCGQAGCGTVYELTPSGSGWVGQTVYEFTGGSDGAGPIGGVAIDSSGNLYGTTQGSGGTIFELQQSGGRWNLSTLYTFNVQGGPQYKPTIDAGGNLYGTVFEYAPYAGEVYKLTHSGGGWTYSDLAIFGHGQNGDRSPYGGVVFDAAGNLYGTTRDGGSDGNGNVWEIKP